MKSNLAILSILMLATLLFTSCDENNKATLADIISQWEGREILFPPKSTFTIQGRDTVDFQFHNAPYKILMYVDSVGCMSCKLHLSAWKGFIHKVDSVSKGKVSTVIYINANNLDEINMITRKAEFNYPVCYDKHGELNELNGFPPYMEYQTFLLDKSNRVLLVGNPIMNPVTRNEYLAIIGGGVEMATEKTAIEAGFNEVDLGTLRLGERKTHRFSFRNVGEFKLVVNEIISSCDCIEVQCDKLIALSGEYVELAISFTPDEMGDFYQMVSVYCNTEDSPIDFYVYGKAK